MVLRACDLHTKPGGADDREPAYMYMFTLREMPIYRWTVDHKTNNDVVCMRIAGAASDPLWAGRFGVWRSGSILVHCQDGPAGGRGDNSSVLEEARLRDDDGQQM